MPELPEVEVVRRGLAGHVVGHTIDSAAFTGHRVAREHPGGAEGLADELAGSRIHSAERRGKYLWLTLGDAEPAPGDRALVVHLRMSGQLLIAAPELPAARHTHARLTLSDGQELRFVDQRTFGYMTTETLIRDPHAAPAGPARVVPSSIAHIAPDPFEATFDIRAIAKRMHARDVEIKRQLLEQTLVAGIGNIYADEALWTARVHGRRLGSRLTIIRIVELLEAAREVMDRALDAGGTSFDALYVNVNGSSGYFSRSLNAYGRLGEPCSRCGEPMSKESIGGRGSYFCPTCQPAPRKPRAVRRKRTIGT